MTLPLAGAIGGAAGIGTGLIGSKIYSKITGKPAGAPASLAHILTNDKLDKHAKAEVIKEQMADSINYTGKALGVATVAAGATAIATGCSNKIAGYAQKASAKAGELLSNVAVKGKDLKSIIKETGVYQKFSALPTPAKAALAVGAAVLTAGLTVAQTLFSQKAGYIEGKHEAK